MAVREILVYPDPRLREKAEPVAEVDDSIRALVEDMAETMYAAPGVGLAANQIGVLKRVFVIDIADEEEPSSLMVFINPEILDVLRRAGALVETVVEHEDAGEPVGRVTVRAGDRRSFVIAPSEVPGLIDELPALGALGALLPEGGIMEVRGAGELRVKESDRISALAAGFRALGAAITEYPDGFRIDARPLHGATVEAAGDHRLAMAFAVAACGASSPTTISGAAAVDVSYPGFFQELERLTRRGDDR